MTFDELPKKLVHISVGDTHITMQSFGSLPYSQAIKFIQASESEKPAKAFSTMHDVILQSMDASDRPLVDQMSFDDFRSLVEQWIAVSVGG